MRIKLPVFVAALLISCAAAGAIGLGRFGAAPAEDALRLFVALPVGRELADRLEVVQNELARDGFRFERSARENLHLTLHYLGEVPRGKLPALSSALRAVASRGRSFALEHRGVGTFLDDTGEHPKVIWTGCRGGEERVTELAELVSRAAAQVGLPPREGEFRAHITLARPTDTSRSKDLKDWVAVRKARPFGTTTVDRFVLYRSVREHGRIVYLPLEEFRYRR